MKHCKHTVEAACVVGMLALAGLAAACAARDAGGAADEHPGSDGGGDGDGDGDGIGEASCAGGSVAWHYVDPYEESDVCSGEWGGASNLIDRIAASSDGGVVARSDDGLVKFDAGGEIVWAIDEPLFLPSGTAADGVYGIDGQEIRFIDEEGHVTTQVPLEVDDEDLVADISPRPEGWFAVGEGPQGAWTASFDAAGGMLWRDEIGQPSNTREGHNFVRTHADGGAIVGVSHIVDTYDGFVRVRRYTEGGEVTWDLLRMSSDGSEYGAGLRGLEITSGGAIIAGGRTSRFQVGPGWLDHISPDGELIWSREGSGEGISVIEAVAIDACDLVYLGGDYGNVSVYDLEGEELAGFNVAPINGVHCLALHVAPDGRLWVGGQINFGECWLGDDVFDYEMGAWMQARDPG